MNRKFSTKPPSCFLFIRLQILLNSSWFSHYRCWLSLFSKNMKSWNGSVVWKKAYSNKLTIKKSAAINVNLHRTSRSIGNWIPKLSASVKYSFAAPENCFVIFPTSLPSGVITSKLISLQQDIAQIGPFISRTGFLFWSHMENRGFKHDHCWRTYPTTAPPVVTSTSCKQNGT